MSPDGRFVATCGETGKHVIVWDLISAAIQCSLSFEGVTRVFWNGSSDKLAAISQTSLDIYSVNGSLLKKVDINQYRNWTFTAGLGWSSDDSSIVLADKTTICLLDGSNFIERCQLHPYKWWESHFVCCVSFDPNDASKLGALIRDEFAFGKANVVLYDLPTEELVFSVTLESYSKTGLYWNNNGSRIVHMCGNTVHLIDPVAGNQIRSFFVESASSASRVSWAPDNRHLVVASDEILCVDTETGLLLGQHPTHGSSQWEKFVLTPDGKQVIVRESTSNVIYIWAIVGQGRR